MLPTVGDISRLSMEGDIELLLDSLVTWHNQLADAEIPALMRAPLTHY